MDSEPDRRANTTQNSETTTVTPIDSRRISVPRRPAACRALSVIPTGARSAERRDLLFDGGAQEEVPRLRHPAGGFARDDGYIGKIRQVVVPCASRLPAPSYTLPPDLPMPDPLLIT